MKYIYLDTSHLLKWEKNTLPYQQVKKLEELTSSNDFSFVFSPVHKIEIANRINRVEILRIFKFLYQLPCVIFFDSELLFKSEIMHAHNLFNNEASLWTPFVLEPLRLDERLTLEEQINGSLMETDLQQSSHARLNDLIKTKSYASKKLYKGLDKQQYKIRLHERFRQRVAAAIKSTELSPSDEFIDFIMGNKNLVPGLRLNYYMQQTLHRNYGKNFTINDLFDTLHCAALPYVDYITFDKQFYEHIKQITDLINVSLEKAHYNIDNLF